MEFNCKVNIVDAIMGAGKTQSIMNYINQSDEDEKFLVITPFLDEIDRYRKYCSCKNFKAPTFLEEYSVCISLTLHTNSIFFYLIVLSLLMMETHTLLTSLRRTTLKV